MRRSLLIFGLLSLAAVWLAPLPQIGRQTFWAHMTMHMVVVAVAAPLLAFGVAGGKFDPVPKAPKLFAPIPTSIDRRAPSFTTIAKGGADSLLLLSGYGAQVVASQAAIEPDVETAIRDRR